MKYRVVVLPNGMSTQVLFKKKWDALPPCHPAVDSTAGIVGGHADLEVPDADEALAKAELLQRRCALLAWALISRRFRR